MLPNGKVLAAGGTDNGNVGFASAELYDPASSTWEASGSLNTGRNLHTATPLPNCKVLVTGGYNGGVLASAELYDIGLGFVGPDWQPQIATVTLMSGRLTLTGSRFQGISQASGGNLQDSSTNYPLVQLRNIDNSQFAFLPVDPTAGWSDTSFTSTPVSNFPPGPALVTVFTNGIPSDSKFLTVQPLLLQLTGAASRKTHSGAGTFDINLPLSGEHGVECRSGGGNYTEVFTFTNNVVSGSAAVTSGTGTISGSPTFSGDTMTVNLTGVTDVQKITVTLTGVADVFSQVLPSTPVSMNVLIGDVNGNRVVNSTDVALIKSQVGQAVSGSNFREDVNADGLINSTDVALTKSHVGDGLP